jgi:hypothetical protein
MMMVLNVLLVFIWCISVNTRYTLYYTDIRQASYLTYDCLHAYLIDAGKEKGKHYIRNVHLIPYCRRPDDNEEQDEVLYTVGENIAETITFKELKKRNVTSDQLLKWFAPIDVAEKYEMNINDSDVFHNCSLLWFGSLCQYKFSYDISLSFGDIVDATFGNQGNSSISNVIGGTYYRFLTGCNNELWPLCLDWREICDRKIDCINGEDEQWCDQLEMTICPQNEYRCHYGGQCIPLSFSKDNRLSIDCLDGSDEIELSILNFIELKNKHCSSVSTFRCQERTDRYQQSFSCGDGQSLQNPNMPSMASFCTSKRDKEISLYMLTSLDHISDGVCRQSFYCALYSNQTLNIGKKTGKSLM